MYKLILFVALALSMGVATAEVNPSVTKKRWAWQPLFNHISRAEDTQAKMTKTAEDKSVVAEEILKTLVGFLRNSEMGAGDEFVSQKENDALLRMIVGGQLKAVDLLRLLDTYRLGHTQAVKDLCATSSLQCSDGKNVLIAFLQMQSRIEEIESGRLDVDAMEESQKEIFLRQPFQCFYYDFQSEAFLQKFKDQKIEELRALVRPSVKSGDTGLVQSLFSAIDGGKETSSPEKPLLSEAEITSILQGWDQRLIVAKCWTRDRIQNWKENYLKHSMPEVLPF